MTPNEIARAKQLSSAVASIGKPKVKPSVGSLSNYYPLTEKEYVFDSVESIANKLNSQPGILKVETISGVPTVEQVIQSIKELKGNDRLDISHLRNGEQLSSIAQRDTYNKKIDMNDMRWHGSGGSSTSSINFATNEVVAGSGTTFTLAHTPTAGTQAIYALGQRLTLTTDYTIASATITTVSTWSAGEILADYRY